MKNALILLAALVATSGRSQGSAPEVSFRHGQWALTVELGSLDAPNVPEAARENIRRMFAGLGSRACMGGGTSNPARELRDGIVAGFSSVIGGGTCSFGQDDTIEGGVIMAQALCRASTPGPETLTVLQGRYDESSIGVDFTMTVRLTGTSGGLPPLLQARGRMTMRRIGECPDQGTG